MIRVIGARCWFPLAVCLILLAAQARAQGANPCLNTQPCNQSDSTSQPSAATEPARLATVNCHGTHGLAVFREPAAVSIIATLACGESVEVLKTGIDVAAPGSGGEVAAHAGDASAAATFLHAGVHARVARAFGQLPLHFEPNEGQIDSQVKFLSRSAGYTLFLAQNEAVLELAGSPVMPRGLVRKDRPERTRDYWRRTHGDSTQHAAVFIHLVGADRSAGIEGIDELPGKSNYFLGNDPKKWRTNVANYAKVRYKRVYPGIDLVYYGRQGHLEYDFVVAPGADPSVIRLDVGTAAGSVRESALGGPARGVPLRITRKGDLIMKTGSREVRFNRPVIYQPDGGLPVTVSSTDIPRSSLVGGRYRMRHHQVSFEVGRYDHTRPLIIDPALSYSTYLGGSGPDGATGVAVDTSGNAYVTGETMSVDFPVTSGTFQSSCAANCGQFDGFITKLNPTGSALLYSTYLGGSGINSPLGVAVDPSGLAYVVGMTESSDFPITNGAFQPICHDCKELAGTAFVTKLNATGSSLSYSTFLGGSSYDGAAAVAVDSIGDAFVGGATTSQDFPITKGAFQTTCSGGCGAGDGFVAELNPAGSALVYATYLGGSNSDGIFGIAVGPSGNAYVAGSTQSPDFPTTPGAFSPTCDNCGPGLDAEGHPLDDAFVSEFSTSGSALVYSTFLGGSDADFGGRIALDSAGSAYVVGTTYSKDFPTTAGAFQQVCGDEDCAAGDAYVVKLSANGSALSYSSYLGGGSYDTASGVVVDPSGSAYVDGYTESNDFPTTAGVFQTKCDMCTLDSGDAFVTEFNSAGSALVYSTFLGGSKLDEAEGIARSASGGVFVAGMTDSSDFPITPGAFQMANRGQSDAFVAEFIFASFSISVTPASISVSPGASAQFTLTLTPQGGFSGAVQVACSGAPLEATCTPSESSVTLNGSSATNVTVSVETTAPSSALSRRLHPPGGKGLELVLLLVAMGSVGALAAVRKKRTVAVLALLALTFLCASCGGGGTNGGPGGGQANPGTPAGTYNLTISATSGDVVQSQTVSLAVE